MDHYNFFNDIIALYNELEILKHDKGIIIKIIYFIDKRRYNNKVMKLVNHIRNNKISYYLLKNFARSILYKFNDENIDCEYYDRNLCMKINFTKPNIEITLTNNPMKHNIKINHTIDEENGNTTVVNKEFKDIIEYSKDVLYIEKLNEILKDEICNYIIRNCLL